MTGDTLLKLLKTQSRHIPREIDHFSIEKVGGRFYVYAHPFKSNINRKKIGTYSDYNAAKASVDRILDLKLGDYGT